VRSGERDDRFEGRADEDGGDEKGRDKRHGNGLKFGKRHDDNSLIIPSGSSDGRCLIADAIPFAAGVPVLVFVGNPTVFASGHLLLVKNNTVFWLFSTCIGVYSSELNLRRGIAKKAEPRYSRAP
jgi:hypothetical protein